MHPASDYVQSFEYMFQKLKKKYPSLEIYGLAYEDETYSAATFGPLFYCKAEDKELTVTYKWQKCAVCGEIFETDVLYNSSQWDVNEGTPYCVCSPTCMLGYALGDYSFFEEVEPDDSFSEEDVEAYYEDEAPTLLEDHFWAQITAHLDDPAYLADFAAKKERVAALAADPDVPAERKAILEELLGKL